jgi:pseudaminic acid synthase
MTIEISGRVIGVGAPPYIVAELSGNHNGKLARALELVEAASAAGADAVKLQTYTPDTITIDHDGPEFHIKGGPWDGYSLYDLYGEASTPWEWHEALFAKARELDITMFSTPFDDTAVNFLETLGAPAYKIASFEAIDLPLIGKVATTGKPMIISTGMASLSEIAEAVEAAKQGGVKELILLHCISAYPAPPEESNLRTITDLATRFGVDVGLSDHSMGIALPLAAVALGACFIEKHMTLRRSDGGPDGSFSLEPDEFRDMVKGCRTAWSSLGSASYDRTEAERGSMVFRRSLYAVADIAAGDPLTTDNVRSIRPGYGLAPKYLPEVLGRRAMRNIARGTALEWALMDRASTNKG